MSWVSRLEQQLVIRTGDGLEYEPQWLNAVQDQQYNLNVFNYIDVAGSQVQRNQPRGRRFSIEIYFIGDDTIDVSERFRRSAADRRPWTIFHPFYDELTVQPISLRFDNTQYNITRITGEVLETIPDDFPRQTQDVVEQIALDKEEVDQTGAETFGNQIADLQPSESNLIGNTVDILESSGNTVLEEAEDQVNFRNLVLTAQRELNTILTRPIQTLRAIQATINFPALVSQSVRARVDNLIDSFNRVIESVTNVANITRNEKVYGEASGAAIISAMTLATTTNRDEQTREQIQGVIDDVFATYSSYLTTLDGFQTTLQTEVNSYAPDPNLQAQLSQLMFSTLAALNDITLDSQQEVTIINEANSNPVLLAHRVYGLDDQDVNLNRFIDTNNLSLNELLIIPKGRELLYYV